MAKKATPAKRPAAKSIAKPVEKTVSTPVRNTAIPKVAAVAAPAKKPITHEMIAIRAFEIYASGQGGNETENWVRAERELRGL
jgi:hypothetical protein